MATFLRQLILTSALLPTLLTAGLPMPDHILYGTIAIGNRPVTRENKDVYVEARRAPGGPVVASYRMGSAARLGEYYYELRLSLEDNQPVTARAFLPGDPVYLTVRNADGKQYEVKHQVPAAGEVLRLDFGASLDTNGDGIPEGWERAKLGTLGRDLNKDSDKDGAPDREEYVAGTHPAGAGDVFRLAVLQEPGVMIVHFRALRSEGIGFEGRSRYYALESSTNAIGGPWAPVVNQSRILGANQLVEHVEPATITNTPVFFRARVWLEGP